DVVFSPDVVQRADVRMRELRDRFRLSLEALTHLRRRRHVRRQHLHRDCALQPRVSSLVDLPHPTRAQRRAHLVGTEAETRSERHRLVVAATLCCQFRSTRKFSDSYSRVGMTARNRCPSAETAYWLASGFNRIEVRKRGWGVPAENDAPPDTGTAMSRPSRSMKRISFPVGLHMGCCPPEVE